MHYKPYEHLVLPTRTTLFTDEQKERERSIVRYVENECREIPEFVQCRIRSVGFSLECNLSYCHRLASPAVGSATAQTECPSTTSGNSSDPGCVGKPANKQTNIRHRSSSLRRFCNEPVALRQSCYETVRCTARPSFPCAWVALATLRFPSSPLRTHRLCFVHRDNEQTVRLLRHRRHEWVYHHEWKIRSRASVNRGEFASARLLTTSLATASNGKPRMRMITCPSRCRNACASEFDPEYKEQNVRVNKYRTAVTLVLSLTESIHTAEKKLSVYPCLLTHRLFRSYRA